MTALHNACSIVATMLACTGLRRTLPASAEAVEAALDVADGAPVATLFAPRMVLDEELRRARGAGDARAVLVCRAATQLLANARRPERALHAVLDLQAELDSVQA